MARHHHRHEPYQAEGNGGVGVYDITDPLNPVLRYRHEAIGAAVPGRNQPGSVKAFATDGACGYLVADQYVKTVQILPASMQTPTTNHTSVLNGGGLLIVEPQILLQTTSFVGAKNTKVRTAQFIFPRLHSGGGDGCCGNSATASPVDRGQRP